MKTNIVALLVTAFVSINASASESVLDELARRNREIPNRNSIHIAWTYALQNQLIPYFIRIVPDLATDDSESLLSFVRAAGTTPEIVSEWVILVGNRSLTKDQKLDIVRGLRSGPFAEGFWIPEYFQYLALVAPNLDFLSDSVAQKEMAGQGLKFVEMVEERLNLGMSSPILIALKSEFLLWRQTGSNDSRFIDFLNKTISQLVLIKAILDLPQYSQLLVGLVEAIVSLNNRSAEMGESAKAIAGMFWDLINASDLPPRALLHITRAGWLPAWGNNPFMDFLTKGGYRVSPEQLKRIAAQFGSGFDILDCVVNCSKHVVPETETDRVEYKYLGRCLELPSQVRPK